MATDYLSNPLEGDHAQSLPELFMSSRYSIHSLPPRIALIEMLKTRGVKVWQGLAENEEERTDDIFRLVSKKLDAAPFSIILATRDYAEDTGFIANSLAEIRVLKELLKKKNKPFICVKMCEVFDFTSAMFMLPEGTFYDFTWLPDDRGHFSDPPAELISLIASLYRDSLPSVTDKLLMNSVAAQSMLSASTETGGKSNSMKLHSARESGDPTDVFGSKDALQKLKDGRTKTLQLNVIKVLRSMTSKEKRRRRLVQLDRVIQKFKTYVASRPPVSQPLMDVKKDNNSAQNPISEFRPSFDSLRESFSSEVTDTELDSNVSINSGSTPERTMESCPPFSSITVGRAMEASPLLKSTKTYTQTGPSLSGIPYLQDIKELKVVDSQDGRDEEEFLQQVELAERTAFKVYDVEPALLDQDKSVNGAAFPINLSNSTASATVDKPISSGQCEVTNTISKLSEDAVARRRAATQRFYLSSSSSSLLNPHSTRSSKLVKNIHVSGNSNTHGKCVEEAKVIKKLPSARAKLPLGREKKGVSVQAKVTEINLPLVGAAVDKKTPSTVTPSKGTLVAERMKAFSGGKASNDRPTFDRPVANPKSETTTKFSLQNPAAHSPAISTSEISKGAVFNMRYKFDKKLNQAATISVTHAKVPTSNMGSANMKSARPAFDSRVSVSKPSSPKSPHRSNTNGSVDKSASPKLAKNHQAADRASDTNISAHSKPMGGLPTAKSSTGELKHSNIPAGATSPTVHKWPGGGRYSGGLRHGKRHGKGIFYYKNGDTYEGDYFEDQMHGQGVYVVAKDGSRYEGGYKYDRRHGVGLLISSNGTRYEGGWKDDLKHGRGKMTFPTGSVVEAVWEHDKRKKCDQPAPQSTPHHHIPESSPQQDSLQYQLPLSVKDQVKQTNSKLSRPGASVSNEIISESSFTTPVKNVGRPGLTVTSSDSQATTVATVSPRSTATAISPTNNISSPTSSISAATSHRSTTVSISPTSTATPSSAGSRPSTSNSAAVQRNPEPLIRYLTLNR